MRKAAFGLAVGMMIAASFLAFTVFYPLTKGEGGPAFSASAVRTSFVNQDVQHDVPLAITVSGMPSGLSISRLSCSAGGGLVSCSVRATECEQSGNVFTCTLTISPLDYTSPSASGSYDPSSRRITLSGNRVTVHYSSADGSGEETMSFGDITITVIPVCGRNGCERQAGESPSACCVDCPCPAGQYCYTGNRPGGECVYVAQKEFYSAGLDPPSATAIPFLEGQQWHFTTRQEVRLRFNVGRNFTLSSIWYRADGKDYKLDCNWTEGSGNEGSGNEGFGNEGPGNNENNGNNENDEVDEVACSLVLPPVRSVQPVYERGVEFFALISYTENGVEHTQSLNTSAKIPITPIPSRQMPVEGCKEKLSVLDQRVETLTRFVSGIHDLCEIWDSDETQDDLEDAVNECCDSLQPEDCFCEQKRLELGILSVCAGQDHSCYLAVHSCLCDSLPHFDTLVSGYQSYSDHLEAVCSAADFTTMSSALSEMRTDIHTVQEAMDAIKKTCEPVTKKSDLCDKENFPTCSMESGLEEHGDINLEILSEPLPSSNQQE